jgi:hypothetical protein
MKDMKQQNTVNLGNFYLSNQCESAQSVVKSQLAAAKPFGEDGSIKKS